MTSLFTFCVVYYYIMSEWWTLSLHDTHKNRIYHCALSKLVCWCRPTSLLLWVSKLLSLHQTSGYQYTQPHLSADKLIKIISNNTAPKQLQTRWTVWSTVGCKPTKTAKRRKMGHSQSQTNEAIPVCDYQGCDVRTLFLAKWILISKVVLRPFLLNTEQSNSRDENPLYQQQSANVSSLLITYVAHWVKCQHLQLGHHISVSHLTNMNHRRSKFLHLFENCFSRLSIWTLRQIGVSHNDR